LCSSIINFAKTTLCFAAVGSTEIKYTHYSVILNEQRRLAFVSAVNIDGATPKDVARGDRFRLDPRVPAALQCGEWLYANNVLDRGHITRRNDAVWGPLAEAEVSVML
jgi:endonuclease G